MSLFEMFFGKRKKKEPLKSTAVVKPLSTGSYGGQVHTDIPQSSTYSTPANKSLDDFFNPVNPVSIVHFYSDNVNQTGSSDWPTSPSNESFGGFGGGDFGGGGSFGSWDSGSSDSSSSSTDSSSSDSSSSCDSSSGTSD